MSDLDNHQPAEGGSYRFSKDGKFLGRDGGTFAPHDPRHERNAAKVADAAPAAAAPAAPPETKPSRKGAPK